MSTCFCSAVREAVLAKGGTEAFLDRLSQPGGLVFIGNIVDMLVRAEKALRNVYQITIDYNRTLEQMIAACACKRLSQDITAMNFPISGTGIVEQEVILVDFDREDIIVSDEVVRELAAMGLEPAGIEHALAFGKRYPDVQRERPVVFLGSVWDRAVPCLCSRGDGRELRLIGRVGGWARRYQFAAVRKVPNAVS